MTVKKTFRSKQTDLLKLKLSKKFWNKKMSFFSFWVPWTYSKMFSDQTTLAGRWEGIQKCNAPGKETWMVSNWSFFISFSLNLNVSTINMPSLSIVAGSGARNLAEQLTLSAYSNQGGTDYAPGFKKFPKYTILFVVHIKQNCVLKYLGNFLNPGGIVCPPLVWIGR